MTKVEYIRALEKTLAKVLADVALFNDGCGCCSDNNTWELQSWNDGCSLIKGEAVDCWDYHDAEDIAEELEKRSRDD